MRGKRLIKERMSSIIQREIKYMDETQESKLRLNDARLVDLVREFAKIKTLYSCALREVTTKFEVLNEDLSTRYNRNPIEFITSRIKSPESIVNKLQRRGLELSRESAVENLSDIAGVRVICSFIEDIYQVAEMFTRQDDVRLLEVKDYIKHPKPNGYRSYHMIVEIPVFFADKKRNVKVEVQLRTIAMDFWASLEHQMYYKKNQEDSGEIAARLKRCAEIIAATDREMEEIGRLLYAARQKELEEKKEA